MKNKFEKLFLIEKAFKELEIISLNTL